MPNLKLYSLQRCCELHKIIYIFQITQHMVHDVPLYQIQDGTMGKKQNRNNPRHGTQCVIEYPTNRNNPRHGTQCVIEHPTNRHNKTWNTVCDRVPNKQDQSKTWNTVCDRAPNKQKPSTIHSIKMYSLCLGLICKYLRDIKTGKNLLFYFLMV